MMMMRMVRVARMSSMPWLMLGGGGFGEFYSLREQKVTRSSAIEEAWARVGSSHGWVAAAYLNKERGGVFLVNPVSGERRELPPLPPSWDVAKLILSCSPDHPDCVAVASPTSRRQLAYCFPARPGPRPQWTCLPYYDCSWRYHDFTYSPTEKVLTGIALSDSHESRTLISNWDIVEGTAKHHKLFMAYQGWPRDVLESFQPHVNLDQLYHSLSTPLFYTFTAPDDPKQRFVVCRYVLERMYPDGSYAREINSGRYKDVHRWAFPYKTVAFHVCRVDFDKDRMDKLLSLDGLAIFVGLNHTFALPAADYPPLKPNSIYFTDCLYFDRGSILYGGHDIGVFDYQTGAITPCYYPTTFNQITWIYPTPLWIHPNQH